MEVGDRVRVKRHRHPEYIGQETTVHEISRTGVVVKLKQNVPFGDPEGFWEMREQDLELIKTASPSGK